MPNYSGKWTPSQILQARGQDLWPINGPFFYVDDVFSTYLYDGDKVDKDIVNGIDLAGEGGLVWIKARSGTYTRNHFLFDTERGATKALSSNTTAAESSLTNDLEVFNSDGFNLGTANNTNSSTEDYVSWTFRKQAGFFDVVTYTGNGTAGRTVSHNLGSVPGCIIVKSTSTTGNWMVYHRGTASDAETDVIRLNLSDAAVDTALTWNDTAPTSTEFTLGTSSDTNNSGTTYVAYLFAHDDTRFGDNADESIIKCGSYTGTGANDNAIDVGFEPQWLLWKPSSTTGDWQLVDNMRGFTASGVGVNRLEPNTSDAEAVSGTPYCDISSTGFVQHGSSNSNNGSSQTYIYIAIRRPMKTPEAGTDVFKPNDVDNGASKPDSLSNFPVDMYFRRYVNTTNDTYLLTRLTSPNALKTNGTDAEAAFSTASAGFDYNDGVMNIFSSNNSDFHTWMFKRATGFFDVVAYTGDGASSQSINHNLGVTPEMMIVKRRESAADWICYHSGNTAAPETEMLKLNTTDATTDFDDAWRDTAPTSSVFTVGSWSYVNASGGSYIAYLFATLAGVSKVGSYTGTAASLDIDCGFTAGARFILIKRTDSTSDWYVWDSERGIVSGDDPYLLLNTTGVEQTNQNYVNPYSAGFTMTSNGFASVNVSGGTYIFLAIA